MFWSGSVYGGYRSLRALTGRGLISNEVRTSPATAQQQLDFDVTAAPDWFSLTPKGIAQARRFRVLNRLE